MSKSTKSLKRSKLISLEAIGFILRPLHTSLISLIVVRLFTPDLWGMFVPFLIIVEVINTIINWGQKPYLMREFSLSPSKISVLWAKAICSRGFLMLIAFLILGMFSQFRAHFAFLVIWIAAKTMSVMFDSLIQFHRKYKQSIFAESASIVVSLLLIFIYKDHIDLDFLILMSAIAALVKGLILLPMIPRFEIQLFKTISIKKELQLSLPYFALAIAGLLQSKLDLYTVAFFLEKGDIAFYQVTIGFLIVGQTFSMIVLGPFQKNIFRWQGNKIRNLKKTYLIIGVIITSVFSIGLYIILNWFYKFNLDLFYILIFFVYLIPLYFYLIESQILIRYNGEKKMLLYTSISAMANLVLSVILVPVIGIVGALLAGAVCRLILASLVVYQSKIVLELNVKR